MKNNKGITLIALVVTIIVLLILAGVSIAMLTGQNGILNRASQASYSSKLSDASETLSYNCTEAISELYATAYTSANVSDSSVNDLAIIKKLYNICKDHTGVSSDVTVTMSVTSEPTSVPASGSEITVTLKNSGYKKVGTITKTGILWADIVKE